MNRKHIIALAAAVLALALAFGLLGVAVGQCGPGGCPPGGACPTPQPWEATLDMWRVSDRGVVGYERGGVDVNVNVGGSRQDRAPWLVCVVQIDSRSADGSRGTKGTGTIVKIESGPDAPCAGILTCAHILHAGLAPGFMYQGRRIDLKLVGIDALHDVAFLRVKDRASCPKLPAMSLATTPAPQRSAVSWAGFPFDGGGRVRAGNATVLGYEDDRLVMSGRVKDGESGGPIVNSTGIVAVIGETNNAYGGWNTLGTQSMWIRQWLASLHQEPTRPPLVAVEPPPPVPPALVADPCVVLEATVIALEAQIVALRAQVANLATSVAACEKTPGLPASPGPQGPPGKDAVIDYATLRLQLLDPENPNCLPPIYVKKVNALTGEESVEEVHLGEGLIFQMTPHQ